jgi:hypothetical protein
MIIEWKFLLTPIASRIVAIISDDESPSTTLDTSLTRVREIFIFGIRVIRWGIV